MQRHYFRNIVAKNYVAFETHNFWRAETKPFYYLNAALSHVIPPATNRRVVSCVEKASLQRIIELVSPYVNRQVIKTQKWLGQC